MSVNLFSLLCDGNSVVTVSSMGSVVRYGGPIVYLIVYSLLLLAILVWVDSGTKLPRRLGSPRRSSSSTGSVESSRKDAIAEVKEATSSEELLRVLGVSKSYQADKVVDDVSLGVARDTLFALLGPNGAGKTTTFNMIREHNYVWHFQHNLNLIHLHRWRRNSRAWRCFH